MNWLGEEQTFVIGRYAENKCHTYRPNWIQAWIDHDAAGVVVSVEALENDRVAERIPFAYAQRIHKLK